MVVRFLLVSLASLVFCGHSAFAQQGAPVVELEGFLLEASNTFTVDWSVTPPVASLNVRRGIDPPDSFPLTIAITGVEVGKGWNFHVPDMVATHFREISFARKNGPATAEVPDPYLDRISTHRVAWTGSEYVVFLSEPPIACVGSGCEKW